MLLESVADTLENVLILFLILAPAAVLFRSKLLVELLLVLG